MCKAPCKDCMDRCIGCHGKCGKYAKFQEDNLREKQLRSKTEMDIYAMSKKGYRRKR